MSLAQTWLTAVLHAGDAQPPPDPQIPADYLQKPQRQHPASAQSGLPPYHSPPLPVSINYSKRKRAALAEIDLSNGLHTHKRQRVPNECTAPCAMPHIPQSPLKTSKRIAARKLGDTRNKAQAAESGVDLNATPRPGRAECNPGSGPPDPPVSVPALDETNVPEWIATPSASHGEYTDAEDMDLPKSSMSSITRSTGSKPRSRSPTKRMIDLRVAEKTVSSKTVRSPADVPEDVRKLYKEIQGLARVPRGVIPLGIEDQVQLDAGGDLDDLDVFVAKKTSDMSEEDLLDEFKALRGVRDSTAVCKTQHLHEPSWNERVHCRMLEQAVRGCSGVEYHNITTARVVKELVPSNKYGEILKQKMIDYAITLHPPLVSESQVITRLAASPQPLHRTVNPSDYSPLCHNPIAISIETKSPDGSREHGEVQLSIWVMAYFNRLRMLTQNPVPITLPLILVSDEHWKLLFACDLDGEIQIIDTVDLGSTADIIGCYTILKVLRLLVGWATGTFLKWYKEKVLEPE